MLHMVHSVHCTHSTINMASVQYYFNISSRGGSWELAGSFVGGPIDGLGGGGGGEGGLGAGSS